MKKTFTRDALSNLLLHVVRTGFAMDDLPKNPGVLVWESQYNQPHKVYIKDHTLVLYFPANAAKGVIILKSSKTVKSLQQILRILKRSKEQLSAGEIVHMPTPPKKRRGRPTKVERVGVGASFRGVPFFIESAALTSGRRLVTHVLPERDGTTKRSNKCK